MGEIGEIGETGEIGEIGETGETGETLEEPILEAQGWIKDASGKVVLIAQASHLTFSNSGIPSPSCDDFETELDPTASSSSLSVAAGRDGGIEPDKP